jgi:hypothetical protein
MGQAGQQLLVATMSVTYEYNETLPISSQQGFCISLGDASAFSSEPRGLMS